MSTFTPPAVLEVPTVDVTDPKNYIPWPGSPVAFRLFGHYSQGVRNRGKTLLLLTDGTVTDLGTFPGANVNVDVTQGNGDVFTEQGLGALSYLSLGDAIGIDKGAGPSPAGTIARVFLGGHIYTINATEVAQLTAAGYASGITP